MKKEMGYDENALNIYSVNLHCPNLESDPEHSYDPKVKRPLLAP